MTALALDPLAPSPSEPTRPPLERARVLAAFRAVGWLAVVSATVTAATLVGMALFVVFAVGTLIVAAIALVCVTVVAAVVAALALVVAALLVVAGALATVVAAIAAALGVVLGLGAGLWHGSKSLWTMLERLGRGPRRYASLSSSPSSSA